MDFELNEKGKQEKTSETPSGASYSEVVKQTAEELAKQINKYPQVLVLLRNLKGQVICWERGYRIIPDQIATVDVVSHLFKHQAMKNPEKARASDERIREVAPVSAAVKSVEEIGRVMDDVAGESKVKQGVVDPAEDVSQHQTAEHLASQLMEYPFVIVVLKDMRGAMVIWDRGYVDGFQRVATLEIVKHMLEHQTMKKTEDAVPMEPR